MPLAGALVALLILAPQQGTPRPVDSPRLQVLRATPSGDATARPTIIVTFDRPVAPHLDASVNPATVLSVSPSFAGRVRWRDPVTVVLRADEILPADTRYTVTVSARIRAVDRTTLPSPYKFSFRTPGAVLLAARAMPPMAGLLNLSRIPQFEVVYSREIDPDRLVSLAHFAARSQPTTTCRDSTITLTVLAQRPVADEDGLRFDRHHPWTYFGQGSSRPTRDSLSRVVIVTPRVRLAKDCRHTLTLPHEVGSIRTTYETLTFGTHTAFVLWPPIPECPDYDSCRDGTVNLKFSTPVYATEVQRHVSVPGATTTVLQGDATDPALEWTLQLHGVKSRQYTVELDTALRDMYDQHISPPLSRPFVTRGGPRVWLGSYSAIVTVERSMHSLPIWSRGADTLRVWQAAVPEAMTAAALFGPGMRAARFFGATSGSDSTDTLFVGIAPHLFAVHPDSEDDPTAMRFSLGSPGQTPSGLFAMRLTGHANVPASERSRDPEPRIRRLVQVTDLAVQVKTDRDRAIVWVKSLTDGRARPHTSVTLHDKLGNSLGSAQTDAHGFATISIPPADSGETARHSRDALYVTAVLGDDHAVVVTSGWGSALGAWALGANARPAPEYEAAVFTDRGIYRPGESVHIAILVRDGRLGALHVPETGTRIRVRTQGRGDETPGIDTTVLSDSFGFGDVTWNTGHSIPLGDYGVRVDLSRGESWVPIGDVSVKIAEYRAPTFAVSAKADTSRTWYAGDTLSAAVGARYLYGAPMARTPVWWTTKVEPLEWWQWRIHGYESWAVGDEAQPADRARAAAGESSGVDTLDAAGAGLIRVPLRVDFLTRPAQLTFEVVATDIDRQQVAARVIARVDPADFYLAARTAGSRWFLPVDSVARIDVAAVRPDGTPIDGVTAAGVVVRTPLVAATDAPPPDTVARCELRTVRGVGHCAFTPTGPGQYKITLSARDSAGRLVRTVFSRWSFGGQRQSSYVRQMWERNFKMVLSADRDRYTVGDTATIVLASEWDTTDAWVTVEREGIFEQRLEHLIGRAPTLRIPIAASYAPNVFVGVVAMRGRTAALGDSADPGAPALRAGYVELAIDPGLHRLTVKVTPSAHEYAPGDSARIDVRVSDKAGLPSPAEIALWAVDEGVLSLTQYTIPDPMAALYGARGVNVWLWSDMEGLSAQFGPGWEQVSVEQGLMGISTSINGARVLRLETQVVSDASFASPLRSNFATTPFFLTRLRTDAGGRVEARVRLPGNLTTFRVIAVAATVDDKYGVGDAPLVVTRALVARPALPRFVRVGDVFDAGAVITRRDGASVPVHVLATSSGITLEGDSARTATLDSGRGREVAFAWRMPTHATADSVLIDLRASDGVHADAVRTVLPVRPVYHPRAWAATGRLTDTMTVALALPSGIDPDRSRIVLDFGTSPLTIVRGIARTLHVYPYNCTEQVVSSATALLTLWRARRLLGDSVVPSDAADQLAAAVATIASRQGLDGGIGYWGREDWSSPWLSAYAGNFLISARDAGVPVDRRVLEQLTQFLESSRPDTNREVEARWRWRDEIAAVEFLAAAGHPQSEREDSAVAARAQITLEDRARLAELVRVRRPDASLTLMREIWKHVHVDGRRAVVDDTTEQGWAYFPSLMRPTARVLHATMTIAPTSPLNGPLSETLIQHARATPWWNTQDYAFTVWALSAFLDEARDDIPREVDARQGGHLILHVTARPREGAQVSLPLNGLLSGASSAPVLKLKLSTPKSGLGAFFYITVDEVPLERPTHPDSRGLSVERWYERYSDGSPIVSAAAGDLVRVRLRVIVPTLRQFVVLDDPLPAGFEAVDTDLRTTASLPRGAADSASDLDQEELVSQSNWRWRCVWWWGSWTHRELRDDRVVFSAPELMPGTYLLTYIARATTSGTFVRPPTHVEEMYNPAVHGRSDGGTFVVGGAAPQITNPRTTLSR